MGDDIVARLLLKIEAMGEGNLAKVGAEARAAGKEAEGAGHGFLSGKAAMLAFAGAGVVVAGAIAYSIHAASDFEDTILKVANNTGMTTRQMEAMRANVLALGREAPVPLADIASGFEKAANAGFQGRAAFDLVHASMKAAVETGVPLGAMVDTVTLSLKNFKMPASESGKALSILMAAAADGDMRLPEMAAHFNKVAALAGAMKQPLDQTAANFATITRFTHDASQAQTQYAGMLAHVANMTGPATKLAQGLAQTTGIDLVDAFKKASTGQMTMNDLMIKAKEATHGNVSELMTLFGGLRGGQAALALINQGWKDHNQILEDVRSKTHLVADEWKRSIDTIGAQGGIIRNQLQELAIAFGTNLLPAVVGAEKQVESFLKYITDHQKDIETFVANVKAFADQTLNATKNSQGFKDSLKSMGDSLHNIGDSLHTFGRDIGLISDNSKKAGDNSKGLRDFLVFLANLSLQPLVLTLKSVDLAVRGITNAFDDLVRIKGAIEGFVNGVRSAFDRLRNDVGSAIHNLVTTVMGAFQQLQSNAPAAAAAIVAGFLGAFNPINAGAVGIISGMVAAVIGQLAGFVGAVAAAAAATVAGWMGGLRGIIGQSTSAVSSMVSAIAGILSGLAGEMFSWASNAASSFAQGLLSQVGAVAGAAKSLLDAAGAALKFLSPNKLGDDPQKWGRNMGWSWATGLERTLPKTKQVATDIVHAAADILGGPTTIQKANQWGQVVGAAFAQGLALGDASMTSNFPLTEMGRRNFSAGGPGASMSDLWQARLQNTATWLATTMNDLGMAIRDGAKNLNPFIASAVAATKAQDKLTAAATQAAIKVDLASGHYKDAVDATQQLLQGKVDNALSKYAYDLIHHTGSLNDDAKAIVVAQNALNNWTDAVDKATAITNATFGRGGTLVDASGRAAGGLSGVASASGGVATQFQTVNTALSAFAAALQAVDIQNLSSAFPSTPGGMFDFIGQQLTGQLNAAQSTYAYDLLTGNTKALSADTQAILDLQKRLADWQNAQKMGQQVGSSASLTTFNDLQQKAQQALTDALNQYAYDLTQHTGNLSADAAAIQAANTQVLALQANLNAANAIINQTTATFSTLQSTANTAATNALDSLALAIVRGSGDIGQLSAAAIAAAQSSKQYADALAQAQQIVTNAMNPTAVSPYNAAIQNAQKAYDDALLRYEDAVVSGANGGTLGNTQDAAVQAGIALKKLQDIAQSIQNTIANQTQVLSNQGSQIADNTAQISADLQKQLDEMQSQRDSLLELVRISNETGSAVDVSSDHGLYPLINHLPTTLLANR